MNKKYLIYGALIFLVVILAILVFTKGAKIDDSKVNVKNADLEKYRSDNIPEECRLPASQDIESWKEHLEHHENTKYCLEYFK